MPLSDRNIETVHTIAEILAAEVRRIFIVTGAGISADSGLPTYRGIGGLYNSGETEDGYTIEEAISGDMIYRNPAISWKYISQIEASCREASFNRAHEVIAEMDKAFDHVCVLTQNIDGFHHRAGSENVIDIHGDIHDLRCMSCEYTDTVEDYSALTDLPPVCPDCGGMIRPGVVLLGEQLPLDKVDRIMEEWAEKFDIVFTVGTTSMFPYISQPVHYARYHDILTVEINPGETYVTDIVDFKIDAGAAKTLDAIWEAYKKQKSGD